MTTQPDLRTPTEWAKLEDCLILDADGWRGGDAKSFDEPITQAEYERRRAISTCRFPASYDQAEIDRLAAKRAAEDADMTTPPAGQLCGCPIFTTHTTHGNPWCACGHQYSDHTRDGAACTMPATAGSAKIEGALYAAMERGGIGYSSHQRRGPVEFLTPIIAGLIDDARRQVAEQIAAACDQRYEDSRRLAEGGRDILPKEGRVGIATGYQRAAKIAREIGGGQ